MACSKLRIMVFHSPTFHPEATTHPNLHYFFLIGVNYSTISSETSGNFYKFLGIGNATIQTSCTGQRAYHGVTVLKRSFSQTARLLSSSSPEAATIQRPAPEFKGTAVVDGQFKQIALSDYRGKYVVLFFYPLDFTFVCPTEIIAFSDRVSEFKALNCEVIACSVDSHFSHLAWCNIPRKSGGLGEMKIPLLSDLSKSVSRDYGVLLETPGVALRGLFIIDSAGTLRQVTVNDLPVGRSVDETLRLVKAFQFVEKHGEVCPANWTPDSPSIKPDPQASKEYFEKVN